MRATSPFFEQYPNYWNKEKNAALQLSLVEIKQVEDRILKHYSSKPITNPRLLGTTLTLHINDSNGRQIDFVSDYYVVINGNSYEALSDQEFLRSFLRSIATNRGWKIN
jgi:hypothetical protein